MESLTNLIIIIAVIFLFLFVVILLLKAKKKPLTDGYTAKSRLLTPAELDFFSQLIDLVPANSVMCQVPLSSLFRASKGESHTAQHNKINRKTFDFVIIDPTTSEIKCAIELDDGSHRKKRRVERDQFVNAIAEQTGVVLLRFKVGHKLKLQDIQDYLPKSV